MSRRPRTRNACPVEKTPQEVPDPAEVLVIYGAPRLRRVRISGCGSGFGMVMRAGYRWRRELER
jgi:hypothetical protein